MVIWTAVTRPNARKDVRHSLCTSTMRWCNGDPGLPGLEPNLPILPSLRPPHYILLISYQIPILPRIPLYRLIKIFLAAEAELLYGFGDSAEGAVDFIRIQVFGVVIQQTADKKYPETLRRCRQILHGSITSKKTKHTKVRWDERRRAAPLIQRTETTAMQSLADSREKVRQSDPDPSNMAAPAQSA